MGASGIFTAKIGPSIEDDCNDHVHVREILEWKGFVTANRLVTCQEGDNSYIASYELADDSVIRSPELAARDGRPSQGQTIAKAMPLEVRK